MQKKEILAIFIIGVIFTGLTIIFGNYKSAENKRSFNPAKELQSLDFKIGGIYLKQPITEVLEILGKPSKIEKRMINDVAIINYYFSGLVVAIFESDQIVFQIEVANNRFKSFRGIGIGDKEEDVYCRYGFKEKIDSFIVYDLIISDEPSIYYAIMFLIEDAKVIKIEYQYGPG